MVGDISEREVYGFVLQEIVPELVPLTTDPSKRKTCRNSDFAAGHFSDIQFPRDGRKRQHIVVQIPRLIRKELLVPFTDQVELAFIDKQILLEHRLLVIGGNACRKAAVCGFDIAVAAVDSDYDYIVDHLHVVTSMRDTQKGCPSALKSVSPLFLFYRLICPSAAAASRKSGSHSSRKRSTCCLQRPM